MDCDFVALLSPCDKAARLSIRVIELHAVKPTARMHQYRPDLGLLQFVEYCSRGVKLLPVARDARPSHLPKDRRDLAARVIESDACLVIVGVKA